MNQNIPKRSTRSSRTTKDKDSDSMPFLSSAEPTSDNETQPVPQQIKTSSSSSSSSSNGKLSTPPPYSPSGKRSGSDTIQSSPSKSRTTVKITVPPTSHALSSLAENQGYGGQGSLLPSATFDTPSNADNGFVTENGSRRRSGRLASQEKREQQRKEREIEIEQQIQEGNAKAERHQGDDTSISNESTLFGPKDIDTDGLSEQVSLMHHKLNNTIASETEPQSESTASNHLRKSKRIHSSSASASGSRNGTEGPEDELVLKRRKLDNNSALPNIPVLHQLSNGETEFIEPPLDSYTIGFYGLPWTAQPSEKLKKEAAPAKVRIKRRILHEPKQRPNEKAPEVQEKESIERERLYQSGLKTTINEKLQKESDVRTGIKNTVTRNRTNNKVIKSINGEPSTPSSKVQRNRSKSHIKTTASPIKRPTAGLSTGAASSEDMSQPWKVSSVEVTHDNNDWCSACGDTGVFLCCDGCEKSFHFACCSPPYSTDNLPSDDNPWYCHTCAAKRNNVDQEHGLFGKLLMSLQAMDPVQYKLPRRIRERFQGVYTAPNGNYYDDSQKPFSNSKPPRQVFMNPDNDADLYVDKATSLPLNCSKCGAAACYTEDDQSDTKVVVKPMITCDYCPSSWHLDCLSPPLATVKQMGKKWRCSNHINDLVTLKRRLRKGQVYIDYDCGIGVKNDGDIEIRSDDDHGSNINEDITIPVIKNFDTKRGITAAVSTEQEELWKAQSTGIARLPAHGIIIDFANSIQKKREKESEEKINEIWRLTRENNALLRALAIGSDTSEANGNVKSQENWGVEERLALVGLVDLKRG